MKKNLVEISGNVYAAWSKPGEGGVGWYKKGEPQCSKIKDAAENKMYITLKYGEASYMLNNKVKTYTPGHNLQFYVIKEGKKYYIDVNSKSFNNIDLQGQQELLKYLKAKI